jgi:integrase
MLLSNVLDRIVLEFDLQPCTIKQYRMVVSRFSAWLGKKAELSDLTMDNLNGFLFASQQKLNPTTIRNYRVAMTRVWNYASETEGIPSYNPKRLRRQKLIQKPVLSWSQGQVSALLKGSQDLMGELNCGIKQSELMQAWILVGYDTGLRPIDLRFLRWANIDFQYGTLSITQHKTRRTHTALLSEESKKALKAIQSPERDLVFPLGKGGCRRLELKLFEAAKRFGFRRVRGQGIGTLRKSHATEIYKKEGEVAAAESLGHVGGVRTVRASYIDHREVRQGRLPPKPDVA